jgi:predicted nucleotidyltransferase
MIIHRALDEVFSARSNIMVMRALKNSQTGLTGREISRIVGVSPKAGLKSLTLLEDLGMINRVRGGRDHIFTFNRDNFLVDQGILPLLESELFFRESLFKDITAKLKKDSPGAYLFGSVARKEETISSDLDICILYESGVDKSALEKTVSEIKPKLYVQYGVNIAPLYMQKKEFIRRAKGNKPPAPSIIKDGLTLFGLQLKQVINAKTVAKDKR